jgi:uncharacterized membrane protein YdjX (TVP38/TMEM64 family)
MSVEIMAAFCTSIISFFLERKMLGSFGTQEVHRKQFNFTGKMQE